MSPRSLSSLAASAECAAEGIELPWQERRQCLRARLAEAPPPGLSDREIDAHFEGMPPHYWEHVNAADLLWGLQLIHDLPASPGSIPRPTHPPRLAWRDPAGPRRTQILLGTTDRPGLLAKAAASFSAAGLSIREAGVFTRADGIVLDAFAVANADHAGPASPARLEQFAFLLEGALSEPPRFASIWACTRHKYLAPPPRFPPRIRFDPEIAPGHTLLHIETCDRLGLLYDILQALADAGLNVLHARIETDRELARDVFTLTDAHGRKVADTTRLATLRQSLESAIGIHP